MMLPPGARVRVRSDWPEFRAPAHIRTPHYVRGLTGEVVRHLGDFANPEDLAFARPAATRALYHVRFAIAAIWHDADQNCAHRNGAANDLLVEIFDNWLEAAP